MPYILPSCGKKLQTDEDFDETSLVKRSNKRRKKNSKDDFDDDVTLRGTGKPKAGGRKPMTVVKASDLDCHKSMIQFRSVQSYIYINSCFYICLITPYLISEADTYRRGVENKSPNSSLHSSIWIDC